MPNSSVRVMRYAGRELAVRHLSSGICQLQQRRGDGAAHEPTYYRCQQHGDSARANQRPGDALDNLRPVGGSVGNFN